MTETETAELATSLSSLAQAFREPLDSKRLALYLENLSDLVPARLFRACEKAGRELDRFPTIATLRRMASGVEGYDGQGRSVPDAAATRRYLDGLSR